MNKTEFIIQYSRSHGWMDREECAQAAEIAWERYQASFQPDPWALVDAFQFKLMGAQFDRRIRENNARTAAHRASHPEEYLTFEGQS